MRRCGLTDNDGYAKLLTSVVRPVLATNAQTVQTLAQASFDTWIKFYKPSANTVNANVSYYRQGALAAWVIDASIRAESKGAASLDDVMRALWQQFCEAGKDYAGLTEETFLETVAETTRCDLTDLIGKLIHTTERPDYQKLLKPLGVTFEETKTNEKSKIEVSDRESPENAVKKNNFTGLSAIIPGQADPGTLPSQPAPAPAAPAKPATKTSAPAAPEKPTAAAQPRWKQSSVDADILDPFVTLHSPAAPQEKPAEPFRAAASETQLDVEPDFGETKVQADQNHMAAWDPQPAVPVKEPEKPAAPVQPAREEPEAAAEAPVEPEQMNFAPADGPEPLRYVGEVFRTYILAERGDELCLIDKHAAHERQLYEKLAANYGNVPSQMLLEPTAIDLSAEEKQALLDHVPLLENAGLEIADFGGNTVVLRAVPADVEPQTAERLLIEIANKLLKGGHDALNEHTEWVLHSISCRAAIKAGDKSSPQELLALAEKILSGEVPPFCPHGRPCVLKLTRKELEKQFGRIV